MGAAAAKTVLITGASSGLGVSLAVMAAKAGHDVVATMRNLGKRAALDAAAEAAGVRVSVMALDVQSTASVEGCVAGVIAKHGKIDVLIANAGAGFVRTTEQATEADITAVMDVNFMGVVRCVKAVLPHMRMAQAGHVIAVSSVGGLVGQPFNEIYCAAKFAVEGYIESLASYLGPAFGIGFTAVEPGGIVSEFAKTAMQQYSASGGMIEDEYLPLIQKYMGRIAERGAAAGKDGAPAIYQTADQVAEVILECVGKSPVPVRLRTSEWGKAFCHLKTGLDPDGTKLQAAVVDMMLGDLG
jgi:NAD(P)-dependent dehydrogenase (short-subunit alcohol dehydrogenase family)